ncbi:helix-turn-helix transcriptional regulator [Adlercreutzia equolifaciens]|uniref:helix-turn-helix domain-containing protein n=1 Tax=Adlercreutzia equolifaciens TaxID=446660 RepID=UPI0023AE9C86|nr:helix-turn-helix transcriptional regulator [Adlercreutzia equolifaciens]MDE8701604.1 helix-turn-helix transcriptional regulator [Adlercreutzia equolifaciens]
MKGNLRWLAGFSLYWAWVVIVFYSDTLMLFSTDPASSLEVFWVWATWAHFVGLVLFAILGARTPQILTGKLACWAAGCATALGAAAAAGSFPLASQPGGLWLSFGGAFLIGLSSSLVLLQWAAFFERAPSSSVGIASVMSFAGGLLVYLVARLFPLMVDFSLVFILPLASAAILAGPAQECASQGEGEGGGVASSEDASLWRRRSFVLGLVALVLAVVVFAVCGELLRSLSVRVGGAGAQAMGIPYLTGGLVGLAVLVAVLLIPGTKRVRGPRPITVSLLRGVVLVMALAFLVVPFLEGPAISFAYAIFGAGFWCFRAVSWVVCFSGARHLHARSTTFVAVMDAAFAIAVVGGGEANELLVSTIDSQVLNLATVSLFTVFVLMVVALVVLNSSAMRYFVQGATSGDSIKVDGATEDTPQFPEADNGTAASEAPSGDTRLAANVDALAERYGLTPREREVAHLLARGRSLPFVQKELHISQNTAQTHARHIYRKLSVHSRQEFIDLVEIGNYQVKEDYH